MPLRDIVGHRRLLRLISRSIAGDTLPPSLIFSGPAGVGKRRTATSVAQVLNCRAPVVNVRPEALGADESAGPLPVDACGACGPCRRIARGIFPDVLALEVEEDRTEITIDRVRLAIDQTGYRPFEGRHRVIIIDDAAEVSGAAMHTLLKSLEEPPDSSSFVLVTSRPDALLPTIRSRCACLRFGPLDDRDLVAALVGQHGLSEQAARGAVPLAGGSLGLALVFASEATEKIRRGVCGALGGAAAATGPDDRFEVGKAIAARGSSTGQPAADRDALAIHLRMLLSLLRDVAALTTGAAAGALTNADLTSTLESLAGGFGRDRAVRAFSAVERALGALDRNASPKIVADWLAFQL